MTGDREEHLSQLLRFTAEALDIPERLRQEAVLKYEEVGLWLGAADSSLKSNSPEIYHQGSFRLGTIIRPLTDKDEYDIDLVCLLQFKKQSITQTEFKKRVGDRLRQNEEYRKTLKEGRRCWTLNFESRFHMDVLPAIPDEEGRKDSILITDKELTLWQHSDPKGYADWFGTQMKVVFEEERQALAKALQVDIEEVPDWKVKTPLQRSIQLLKRHRDLHFQKDREDKPVSIIISTLAALAYTGQANLFEALVHTVRGMPDCIKKRNGVYWVANPVNPAENFADKWREHPQRQDKFFAWLKKVEADVIMALETRGIPEIATALGSSFGEAVMVKAAKGLGGAAYQQRQAGKLHMASGTGTLGSVGVTSVRSHTFHGGVDETKSD